MIPVNELLYGLTEKLNKVAAQTHQDLGIANYISALRGAQIRLINNKMKPSPAGIGMEGNRKRYHDLQNLIESAHKHSLKPIEADKYRNSYTAELKDLNPSSLYILGGYIIADKANCKDRIVVLQSEPVPHADIDSLLSNSHYKPSFEYQETFYTLNNDLIEVFTDGTFTPKEIRVEYLRYPKQIDKAGYINLKGEASTDQDCELAYYLKDELLELAVLELGFSTENQNAVQAAATKIQISE